MLNNEHGIWYDIPGDDAISYEVTDPVTGDSKLVYVELGAVCALPGSILDVAMQDQADALYTDIFGDD